MIPENHLLITFLLVSGVDITNIDLMRDFFTYIKENIQE